MRNVSDENVKAIEVGEVFQYELEAPVSVERQRSAMLPILSSAIDGRRENPSQPCNPSPSAGTAP